MWSKVISDETCKGLWAGGTLTIVGRSDTIFWNLVFSTYLPVEGSRSLIFIPFRDINTRISLSENAPARESAVGWRGIRAYNTS